MKLQFKIVGKIDSINKKQKQIISQIRNPEIVSGLDNVKKLVDIKNSSRYHKIRESKPALIKELKNIIKRVVQSSPKEVKRVVKKVIGLEVSKIKLLDKLSNAQRFRKDRIISQLRDQISTVSHKFDQIKYKLKNNLDPLNFANVIKKLNKISSLAKAKSKPKTKSFLPDHYIQKQVNKYIHNAIKITPPNSRRLVRNIFELRINRLKLESRFRSSNLVSGKKMTRLILEISQKLKKENILTHKLKNRINSLEYREITDRLLRITKSLLSNSPHKLTFQKNIKYINPVMSRYFENYIKSLSEVYNISLLIKEKAMYLNDRDYDVLFRRLSTSLQNSKKYSQILIGHFCGHLIPKNATYLYDFSELIRVYFELPIENSLETIVLKEYLNFQYKLGSRNFSKTILGNLY
ncbi:hypothetical protein AYI68_g5397 [Smittium mucronatum]|uniref:Uncharacterized protein n=1 Tax=Smittium mucronatum TaxID=133383 RepID=A0A1R0GUC7_9FUNG|nr:hypothetical protein AYI68_g5397 [Smittium mucronatum]